MRCPYCGIAAGSRVIETRKDDSGIPYRRRRCSACRQSYITKEVLTDGPIPHMTGAGRRQRRENTTTARLTAALGAWHNPPPGD